MPIAIILKSAEVKLVEELNDIREPSGWQAVHFHLSDLLEQYKSEYQIKIAVNLINDLLKSYEGGIFLQQDQSIVVLCRGIEKTLLNKLVFQLRYLYMDDPLAYTDEGHENVAFCTVYDLEVDWQAFSEMCTRRMAVVSRNAPKQFEPTQMPDEPAANVWAPKPVLESRAVPSGPVMSSSPVAPAKQSNVVDLETDRLSFVEQALYQSDISQAIRRQPVCTVTRNLAVRRVFDELYVHIAHLRQNIPSHTDLLGNRWLFKYFTHILDERILLLLGVESSKYLSSPVSININVETILSSKFEEFDARLKEKEKVSLVLEIPAVDVFSDIDAFIVARKELKKRGYRVCLDGLTINSFLNIDRDKLGLDLIKVQWNADVESDLESKANQALKLAISKCGSNRIILCRCDNKQAIEYGQALGISLFQGRYLDSLINPLSKVAN